MAKSLVSCFFDSRCRGRAYIAYCICSSLGSAVGNMYVIFRESGHLVSEMCEQTDMLITVPRSDPVWQSKNIDNYDACMYLILVA